MEGMAWRESLNQRKSASDESNDAAAQAAPPVVVDDVSLFDMVGSSDVNRDLSMRSVGSPNVGNSMCVTASSAVNVSHINYELVGVVVHSGQANAGHYYSFIKDRRYDDVVILYQHVLVVKIQCRGSLSRNLVPANPGPPGEIAIKTIHERERDSSGICVQECTENCLSRYACLWLTP